MVWPGFVIFVPYANQRFADVRRMLFCSAEGGIAVAGCVFFCFFLCTRRYFQKGFFFTSCDTIKSRHILRLIINTVNYQIQSRLMFLNTD